MRPFANLTSDEYFSDGLAEEITNAVAYSDRLKVIARTSGFATPVGLDKAFQCFERATAIDPGGGLGLCGSAHGDLGRSHFNLYTLGQAHVTAGDREAAQAAGSDAKLL